MNVNYEYYHIFYYVAKYRNLTQAAEVMHSNQPNVSRVIKLLEHELGCTLIIRSNRGVMLTPEGERLYSHIKTAVEQIQTAEEAIIKSTALQEGTVSIGASETALAMVLIPILNQFKKKFPGIHIRILNHLANQAIDSVKSGFVDFAVVTTPALMEIPLISCPVIAFNDILVGGPSYAFLQNKPVSLRELSSYPLVCLGENTMTFHFFENFYRSHMLTLKPELEAATTEQTLLMIKNDLGIGFIPEVFAREALQKKEVYKLPLTEKIPGRQICFVENEKRPLSAAAAELKKAIVSSSVRQPESLQQPETARRT